MGSRTNVSQMLSNDGHRPPEAERDKLAGRAQYLYSPGEQRNANLPEKFGIQEEMGHTVLGTACEGLPVRPDSTTTDGTGDLELDSAPESLFPHQQPNQSMPGSTLDGKGYSTNMWSLNPGHSQPGMSYGDRLDTFDKWPARSAKSPEEVAKGGLYYRGQGDVGVCDNCDAAFGDWEENDDPLQLHRKHDPFCPVVVQLLKEQEQQIRMGQQQKQQVPYTSYSQAVLLPPVPAAAHAALAHTSPAGAGIGNHPEGRDHLAQPKCVPAAGKLLKTCATQTEFHVTDVQGYKLCKKCGREPAMLTLHPCMHLVVCFTCYKDLKCCPFCKSVFTTSAVTYCKFGK